MSAARFSRVHHAMRRLAIIASGPSLRGVTLRIPPGVQTMCINTSILHVPFAPDFWFTMDTSPPQREIMATACQRRETTFYAAVYSTYGAGHMAFDKGPAEECVHYLHRIENPGKHGSRIGLSTDPTGVFVGNSAFGGLGVAFLGGALERVALLGVDGSGGYAWGEGKPRNLDNLADLFRYSADFLARRNIEVVVGSPDSVVDCWPRCAPNDALEWLAERNTAAA